MPTLESHMQNCLNKIKKWTNENGSQFSETKTLCIHFCKRRTYHLVPEINIDEHTIPVVQQAKCLGIIFDNKVNFKAHRIFTAEMPKGFKTPKNNMKNELGCRPRGHT